MSVADDLRAYEQQSKPVRLCKTGQWVASLGEQDREVFEQATRTWRRPATDLHRIAISNGCEAGETRFRLHLRRRCCCYPVKAAA